MVLLLLHITPFLKHTSFLSTLIHQDRRFRQMGNWSMRKEIDGCSILCNTSLASLGSINNSELIYMSHKKTSHKQDTLQYICMSCRKFTNLFILAGLGVRLFYRMWSYDTFPENWSKYLPIGWFNWIRALTCTLYSFPGSIQNNFVSSILHFYISSVTGTITYCLHYVKYLPLFSSKTHF